MNRSRIARFSYDHLAFIVLLFTAALLPWHITPTVGGADQFLRFAAFAGLGALIQFTAPSKSELVLLGSVLVAGAAILLYDYVMETQAAFPKIIAAIAGSVWGVAIAHFYSREPN